MTVDQGEAFYDGRKKNENIHVLLSDSHLLNTLVFVKNDIVLIEKISSIDMIK